MTEAGTSKPAPFDILIVHSFSRFFRDHFELEFYVCKLAKNGVRRATCRVAALPSRVIR